uniref:RNA helicase n=1 Tax=Arion vulgaris TaxID=1028688 RepID=A0A0B7AGU6_9EUPU
MASRESENQYVSILSLTRKESEISPWRQIATNGSLPSRCVVVLDSNEETTQDDDVYDDDDGEQLEQDFSDGELSENEDEEVHNTGELGLRNYQNELAENALQGANTIIYAPTGSGKTRVATHIIAQHLKMSTGTNKKVAFLARTVPLATQQYKSLCKYLTEYEICHIDGDCESNMSLHMLLPHNDIVVMTPMILVNHLTRKLLPNLGEFSMLIFDECHHTRKDEPYNTLMKSYIKSKQEICDANSRGKNLNITLPQIIGLTASIGIEGTNNSAEAEKNILKLCGHLDASSISPVKRNIEELRRIVPVPIELSQSLSMRRDDVAVQKIIEIMQDLEQHLVDHIRELNRPELTTLATKRPSDRKSQEYEQWAVVTMKTAKTVPFSSTDRKQDLSVRLIVKIAQHLQGYRSALETYDLVELRDIMDYLDKSFRDLQANEIRTEEENAFYQRFIELKDFVMQGHGTQNPNLQILAEILKKYLLSKGSESRGIVFVRTIALSEALVSWTKRCEIQEFKDLNASIFTGSNMSEEKGGTSKARQEDIIRQFRSGNVRLIVATSVAEEGIDIPDCNLVVKYNHVGNEVSTVQTRGRTRAFNGVSVLLGMQNVLEKEHLNRCRAELMSTAIANICDMERVEFQKVVQEYQKQHLEEILLAEELERARRQKLLDVPFQIVCPMCRQVAVKNTNVRTIYGTYRVSLDRNLLNQIMFQPYPAATPMDGLFFVGDVFCKGETSPGKLCCNGLGIMIKHKGIPMINFGIKKIAFHLNNQDELVTRKRWKQVPFLIEELNYDDIKRYIMESNVLGMPRDNRVANESDEDISDDDN